MRGIAGRIIAAPRGGGFPAAYIASRASGLRGRMVRQWGALLFAEKFAMPEHYFAEDPHSARTVDMPWDVFYLRLRRLYADMDQEMREAFAPVVAFHELRGMFSALRFMAREDFADPVARLIRPSLFDAALKTAVIGAATQAEAAARIYEAFAGLIPGLNPDTKPHALEASVTNGFLTLACEDGRAHPDIMLYFRYLATMRNIITVHKHIRWAELMRAVMPGTRAALVRCGLIEPERIERASTPDEIMALVSRLTGGLTPRSMSSIEAVLLAGLLRTMRINAHTSATPEAVVIDAIARAYAEARNMALIASTPDLDRALVKEELAE